ncbi:hypothetical protein [Pseudomonas schmalbachii]|uniref:Phage protein n=1 Tax=Pseudomonas schmalbachii TaxID=2816993 RepID=A0ABS3TL37_9PSED|nr:hypothetical protein [Pseudomonas schmalbachii]MBO3274118.1 hypothetical protein [Pseudomonas schmalbachii]
MQPLPLTIDPKPIKLLQKALANVNKDQIPFATALALTRLGQRVKAEEIAAMRQEFDRPTPWTLKSLYLKAANKRTQQARVWFIDYASKGTPAGKYLMPQVFGGQRRQKPGESAMTSRAKLPRNRYLVPGKKARRNQYGNLAGSEIQKVLANIRGGRDAHTDTKSPGKASYFFGKPREGRGGDLRPNRPIAVWRRQGRKLWPYQVEVAQTNYQPRFDFFGIADEVIAKHYDQELAKALADAMRSAWK